MNYYLENPAQIQFQNAVFTTLLRSGDKFYFFKDHVQRLNSSALSYFNPKDFSENGLLERINKGLESVPKDKLRVKISIYPDFDKQFSGEIVMSDLNIAIFWSPVISRPDKSLKLVVKELNNTYNNIHKHENYADVLLELRAAKQSGFDDLIYTNNNMLIRSSTSNFIGVVGREIIFPDFLGEKQLSGITLFHLKNALGKTFKIREENIDLNLLKSVNEFYLVNSISGIRHVEKIDNINLDDKYHSELKGLWENYKERINEPN